MRLPRLADRQHLIHHRSNLSLAYEFQRLEQLSFRTHKRSEQRQMAKKNLAQIGARVETARRTASHEPAVVFELADRAGPRRRARVLDHDIDAFSIR